MRLNEPLREVHISTQHFYIFLLLRLMERTAVNTVHYFHKSNDTLNLVFLTAEQSPFNT